MSDPESDAPLDPRDLFDHDAAVRRKRQRQADLAGVLGAARLPEVDDDPDLLDEIADLVAARLRGDEEAEADPAPDFLTGAALHAQDRRQAFEGALLGRRPRPAADDTGPSSGFDGGARQNPPRPAPTLEERTRELLGRARTSRGEGAWRS